MKYHFKKAISFALAILLVISLMPLGVIETPAMAAGEVTGGYGSNGKFLAPIETPVAGSIPISTRAELESIKENLSGNFHLTTDIDLGGAAWTPIGTHGQPFTGIFDGQGYVISNLTITGDHEYGGLFREADYATIKNIGMENTNINISRYSQFYARSAYAGGVCGLSISTAISNCYNTGALAVEARSSRSTGKAYVGGICGLSIDNSSDLSVVSGTISNCYNTGTVSASAAGETSSYYAYAGGICGYFMLSEAAVPISNCYNTGNVTASSSDAEVCAGGICGIFSDDIIANCFNTGEIIASTDGGPYNADAYAGGLCGKASNGSINNCYNAGAVIASASHKDSEAFIGGISGYGSSRSTIRSCYCPNLYGSEYGTQLSAEEMTLAENYLGFDFDTVWEMVDGYLHPQIRGLPPAGALIDDDGTLKIQRVVSPTNAKLSNQSQPGGIDGTITAMVGNSVTSQLINIQPSITDATWKLMSLDNQNNYVELTDKKLPLLTGENTAFIELAAPGFDTLTYLVTITRGEYNDTRVEVFYPHRHDGDGSVSVSFPDSLFESHSAQYNPDLALVAGALTATASDNAEYMRGSNGSYAKLGLNNDKYYNYTTSDNGNTSNEHCFSIASKEITVDGKKQMLIAVILRGSKSFLELSGDWFATANKDFWSYTAYDYFYDYYAKVWNAFVDYVNKYARDYNDW